MNRPLVSIVTPSYNQGQWLPFNLQSVASQTYEHIEHVVMDGKSTDNSVDVLRGAGPKVLWRSEKDGGQAEAINKAFAASSGEIIGWLNSDDAYFAANVVEKIVEYFDRHPNIDLVYGHSAEVNADNLLLHYTWAPPFRMMRFPKFHTIIQPTVFFRRHVAAPMFLDPSYHFAMDGEFWLRSAATYRFGRIARTIAIDRHQMARKSEAMADEAYREALRLRTQYGLPAERSAGTKLVQRVLQAAYRFAAIPQLLAGHDLASFEGNVDSRWSLLRRQIAMRRDDMPAGVVRLVLSNGD